MYLLEVLGCATTIYLRSKSLSEEEGAIDPDETGEEGCTHNATKD